MNYSTFYKCKNYKYDSQSSRANAIMVYVASVKNRSSNDHLHERKDNKIHYL